MAASLQPASYQGSPAQGGGGDGLCRKQDTALFKGTTQLQPSEAGSWQRGILVFFILFCFLVCLFFLLLVLFCSVLFFLLRFFKRNQNSEFYNDASQFLQAGNSLNFKNILQTSNAPSLNHTSAVWGLKLLQMHLRSWLWIKRGMVTAPLCPGSIPKSGLNVLRVRAIH